MAASSCAPRVRATNACTGKDSTRPAAWPAPPTSGTQMDPPSVLRHAPHSTDAAPFGSTQLDEASHVQTPCHGTGPHAARQPPPLSAGGFVPTQLDSAGHASGRGLAATQLDVPDDTGATPRPQRAASLVDADALYQFGFGAQRVDWALARCGGDGAAALELLLEGPADVPGATCEGGGSSTQAVLEATPQPASACAMAHACSGEGNEAPPARLCSFADTNDAMRGMAASQASACGDGAAASSQHVSQHVSQHRERRRGGPINGSCASPKSRQVPHARASSSRAPKKRLAPSQPAAKLKHQERECSGARQRRILRQAALHALRGTEAPQECSASRRRRG